MDKLDKEKLLWADKQKDNKIPISIDDVYEIISQITGVPITKLDSKETQKLLNMEKILSAKVIGQDDAITSISKAIRRNRVGIKEANKPIGSFIFLGSTGVGKTFLAKSLADTLFGDPDKIIRVDMSEYMEKHNVSKLIGSPPGYVGYDEGGQLTEKVKNNPFSVILFDEIEKAHKDVFNILLQILDEGHLTDSFGRKINFTNCLVIMTSNIGAKKVSDFGGGVGFSSTSSDEQQYEVRKTIIQKALKQQFNPEFLNRIDDVVLFNALTDDVLKKIIDIEVSKLNDRLKDKGYKITFDRTVVNRIFELNSEEQYGARPIKRIIQNLCEDFLSEEILKGDIKENEQIILRFKNEKLVFSKK
jgi:ATP-dependent Clp protease ATP-binding subunit ClpC